MKFRSHLASETCIEMKYFWSIYGQFGWSST